MRVLLVDNYDSFTYNLAQLLEESKLCSFDIVKNDKINFSLIESYDKIMLSPGPGLPSEAGEMMKVIEQYHDSKSIFGVCLGMQAIAEFFGGKLINLSQVFHGIKAEILIDISEPIFKGLKPKIEVGLYHSWAVDNDYLPDCLTVTAKSSKGIIMSLSQKKFDVNGVQFHPESYMTPDGRKIIENWLLD